MSAAGYSQSPLIKKLGIKPGFLVRFIDEPSHYRELLGPLPEDVQVNPPRDALVDFIHYFGYDNEDFPTKLSEMLPLIRQNGMIWVSWQKKLSKKEGRLNENQVRGAALEIGMVDVKVCAVDAVWSGLKLVIRKENRS